MAGGGTTVRSAKEFTDTGPADAVFRVRRAYAMTADRGA